MGQNQCNCFNKKTETQLNLNIDQEQAIVKAQQINNENFPSENNSNIMMTYQSENIKTPHHRQIVTIQKVFRGIYFRDKFNQLKPLLQKEENEFITNTIERFNVIQFEKYEMLNPNYNNPISCGITTNIKKYNCKLLIENQFNLEYNKQRILINIGEKGTYNTNIKTQELESFTKYDNQRELIFNRPFFYLIINNETKDVLLIGKILNF